jgi:hypothetical protein
MDLVKNSKQIKIDSSARKKKANKNIAKSERVESAGMD